MSPPSPSQPAGSAAGRLPSSARVVEVGTRDGLQAESRWIPTETKIEIVNSLIAAGIPQLEVTSFVSPRAVPQLRDAAEVMAGVERRDGVRLTALVPNVKGAEAAAAAKVDAMVVFISASESHNLKNLNATRATSLEGVASICQVAANAGIAVQGAIATAFGCPFEGDLPVEEVVRVARTYHALGITQISLGDTTGMATPPLVAERCRALYSALPDIEIALHFHNTRGVGLANVYAGLMEGVTTYEASVAGLGGCPFAPGATGNICTEDLVYLLSECGIDTGVDLERLAEVARRMQEIVGRELPGQFMKAGPRLGLSPVDSVATAQG